MSKKQKKEKRQLRSTRQLMGIEEITPWGVKTAHEDLAFFLVQPDNLTVLSPEGIRVRIAVLTNLLRSTDNLRMMALDSRETYQQNRIWYKQRMEREMVPELRDLLRKDLEHLDSIQASTVSAREFAVVFTIQKYSGEDPRSQLTNFEIRLRDLGFRAKLAGEQDIMRLLAVYYQQDVTTEYYFDLDGARWLTNA